MIGHNKTDKKKTKSYRHPLDVEEERKEGRKSTVFDTIDCILKKGSQGITETIVLSKGSESAVHVIDTTLQM